MYIIYFEQLISSWYRKIAYHADLNIEYPDPCDLLFWFQLWLLTDWENINTLSYYHHQISSMNYYPLLRIRSGKWYALYVSIFLWRHDLKMFPHNRSIMMETTGHRWIPTQRVCNAEFWCFLWCQSEENAIVLPDDLRRHDARVTYCDVLIPLQHGSKAGSICRMARQLGNGGSGSVDVWYGGKHRSC